MTKNSSDNPTGIEELKKSRTRFKGRLTFLTNQWNDFRAQSKPNYPPLHVCESQLEDVEKNRAKFENVHEEIEDLIEDPKTEQTDYEEYMKSYTSLKNEIRGIIQYYERYQKTKEEEARSKSMKELQEEQLKVLSGSHPIYSQGMSLKLPPLDIPTFNGNYLEWPTFYDLFKSAVHNTQLPPAQKLNMLRSKLIGDAALFLEGLSTTSDNYDTIFQTLEKQYQNSRALRSAHLEQLLSISNVQENSHDIQIFADTANKSYTQLKKLNIKLDDILLHVLTTKLAPETRKLWELGVSDKEQPTFDNFIDFLRSYARATSMANPKCNHNQVRPYQLPSLPSQVHTNPILSQSPSILPEVPNVLYAIMIPTLPTNAPSSMLCQSKTAVVP